MSDTEPDLKGTWMIDPAHSRIGFSARHAMISTVRGAFNELEGEFHADPDDLAGSHATVTLQAASIDTRNAQRDEHLRSPDFFDVEKFPTISFTSTNIEEIHERAYIVTGNLTIRDITQQITVPLELAGVMVDSFGVTRVGFEGSRRVRRRDYGLEWNMPMDKGGVLVSEKIDLEFEISAIKKSEGAEEQVQDGAATT